MSMAMKLPVSILSCLVICALFAGERPRMCLNEGWTGVMTPESGEVRTVASIDLPHNWDDYHGYRQHFHGCLHGSAVYTRTFEITPRPGDRTFLQFKGAGSYLGVEVNGQPVVTHLAAGRCVQTLEVTKAIRAGTNDLKVTCEHPSDIRDMPWVCGGCDICGCESPEPFGLFRDVVLFTTGAARFVPYGLHVWPDATCETAFVDVEVDAGGRTPAELKVRISCAALGIDETVSCAEARDGVLRRTYPIAGAKRWSVDEPNLYVFRAELTDAAGVLQDRDEARTGFNTVRWPRPGDADHRFFLNDKPLYVHGASETDHRLGKSIAFEPEEIDARVAEYKKLGMNIFREGHEPHDHRYHERLEESGILWWPGFSTHEYVDTEEFRANFRRLLEQFVRERRNSPAVVLWGFQNESTLPVEFAKECVALVKRLDPRCGERGRLVVTCNYGGGADWNVIQNWSGTYIGYGRTLLTYEKDLVRDDHLLNGEYGAYRLAGWHSDPDAPWDVYGPCTEEHQARILYEKIMRGWSVRDRVCGQLMWPFFSHQDPSRGCAVDEGYRVIDKLGGINYKGLYTCWGRRVEAWYLYYAYGRHMRMGDLDEVRAKPLSWWLAEGHRLAEPATAPALSLRPRAGVTYIHRLNCGGDRFTDSLGNVWSADDSRFVRSWSQDADLQFRDYALNPVLGSQDEVEGEIKNVAAADCGLLRSFRYGRERLRFEFPAPTNAVCAVEMYFVEPGSYGRQFDIAINGMTVERRFRLADAAPERNAVRRAWQVRTGADGMIRITFPKVSVNQALVSAIAISTDAASAKTLAADSRKPGYPESDGLSWKELTAMVRHRTPRHLLPDGGETKKSCAGFAQVLPIADKDGLHRAWVALRESGDYSMVFRVLKGNPVGKTIHWVFQDENFTCDIRRGDTVITEAMVSGDTVTLPTDCVVNAGVYTFCFSIPDDSISMREMK